MPSTTDQLDLHGLTAAAAIERFVVAYNLRIKRAQFACWTVVHGYGSTGEGGVIRSKLRKFLDAHLDKLRYEPGDNYGNPGWTWVHPKLRLPDQRERLALAVLDFCSASRVEDKILREFVGDGGVQVKEVIRSLVKQGRLKSINQGSRTQYQAVAT